MQNVVTCHSIEVARAALLDQDVCDHTEGAGKTSLDTIRLASMSQARSCRRLEKDTSMPSSEFWELDPANGRKLQRPWHQLSRLERLTRSSAISFLS